MSTDPAIDPNPANYHDHDKVREFARHEADVATIRRQAAHWRLTDCDEPTLTQMRHALLDEMARVEKMLDAANQAFLHFVQQGNPVETERSRQQINRISAEWKTLNAHLQEIDQALLERHLHSRLLSILGSRRNLNLLEAVIFIAILVAVALTLFEIFVPISAETFNTFVLIDTLICFLLLGDFFFRLWAAEDRRWYVSRYWIDFVSSIPATGILRLGRLARIARFARILRFARLSRAARSLSLYSRGLDQLMRTLELKLVKRSVWAAIILLTLGAIAILLIEGNQSSSIGNIDQSLWWSFTTVITGGYADLYNPTTLEGRLITVGLILVGFVITSILIASLTSVLVTDDADRLEQHQFDMEVKLQALEQRLDLISGETNQGLIALEVAAQQLSNQDSAENVAAILTTSMINDFESLQASIHLYDETNGIHHRLALRGLESVAPPENIAVGTGFIGRVADDMLRANLSIKDIEPVTEPCLPVRGTAMVCPLVAFGRYIGVLHTVLPSHLGRYYLYNRAPMTMAHHAAIAIAAHNLSSVALHSDPAANA
ncbi:MAG: ion transporter [Anaerolineae bacterium]|nr:ion transporter [Anaerolineae bacterium]